jgi:hypothetical protein
MANSDLELAMEMLLGLGHLERERDTSEMPSASEARARNGSWGPAREEGVILSFHHHDLLSGGTDAPYSSGDAARCGARRELRMSGDGCR